MVNSRRKGHNYERQIVKDYKSIGFSNAATSRSESIMMDNL